MTKTAIERPGDAADAASRVEDSESVKLAGWETVRVQMGKCENEKVLEGVGSLVMAL